MNRSVGGKFQGQQRAHKLVTKRRHDLAWHVAASMVTLAALSGQARVHAQTAPANASPQVTTTAQTASQDGSAVTLGDVKVTAERRTTSLQKTPLSVGVVGGGEIARHDIQKIADLSGEVAGVYLSGSSTPSLQPIYIRGIGTSSPTYNGAVGIYLDDVYVPRIINSGIFGLPDVRQIEVLRGPQGTLYGQNTSAGAIRIISRDPSNEKIAWVSAGVGNYGGIESKAYVSGPIKEDVLYGSLAYSHTQNYGFTYNETLHKDVDGVHTDLIRGKLRATPTRDFDAQLTIDALRDRSDNGTSQPLNYPGSAPRTTFDNTDPKIHNDGFGVSLRLTDKIDDHLTAKSITAYRQFNDSPDPWPYDGVPSNLYGWQLNLNDHQLSQEFQLLGDYGPLTFTTGAIAFNENFGVNRPNWTAGAFNGISSRTNVLNLGLYAQAHYKFTEQLGATLGLRYYVQNDNYSTFGYSSNPQLQIVHVNYEANDLHLRTDGVTPKFGLDYQLLPGLFSYASITKGEKSGAYNPVAGALSIALVPVFPEKVTAYEAGLKGTSFGGRLQTDLAVFYNDFANYQGIVTNPIVNGAIVNGSVTVNAGKAHTFGAEFEATAHPLRDLEWRFNVTALQGRFDSFLNPTGAPNANYTGHQLPNAPHLTVNTSLLYRLPVKVPGSIDVNGSLSILGKNYLDVTNTTMVPTQVYVNLGASYQSPGHGWTTNFQVTNLLNRTYPYALVQIASLNINAANYNPPRVYMVTLRHDFY
ncbi:MAG: TonB-dependent receptor [Janthinobacterium lividum]